MPSGRFGALSYEEMEEGKIKRDSVASSGYIPDVLFDGYAVLSELTDAQKHFVSPEAVSAVLDAVVRLIKRGI